MTTQDESFKISGHTIHVVSSDLAALPQRVAALVSSDDNYLSHGGGVSRALWKGAGRELADFVAKTKPQLHLGDVFITPAGSLNAELLVHAVTIDLDQNRTITESELPALYVRVFDEVATQYCEHVGLPLLGAGEAGVSPRASATAFVDALISGLAPTAGFVSFTFALKHSSDWKAVDVFRDAQQRERDIQDTLGQIISRMPGEGGESLRRAWQQYSSGDPDERASALALLWGHVSDLLERFPGLLDESVVQQVARDANLARNRVAHGRSGTKAHDWGTLLSAIRVGLSETAKHVKAQEHGDPVPAADSAERWSVLESRKHVGPPPERTDAIGSAAPSEDWNFLACRVNHDEVDRRPSRRTSRDQPALDLRFSNVPIPARSGTPSAGTTPRATADLTGSQPAAPVRELRDFLSNHLPSECLSELDERLQAEGYKGPSEIRLLEFLIRERDLVEFVAGEFGYTRLRAAIRQYRGEDPPRFRTGAKLAAWFLTALGFPQPVRPQGLKAVRQAIQAAEAQLLLNNDSALRGVMSDVARRFEYVCRVMLRFIAQAAYHKAPEQLFREWGELTGGQTLDKVGLGTLMNLVEVLNSHLDTDSSPEVQLFRRDVAKGPLFPPNTAELTGWRNMLSHYRPEESGASLARTAKDFLTAAKAFIEYLDRGDNRVFPQIVLVEDMHQDRWGRKVIEAVDDEGNREVIFTEDPISPGHTYFMHPLTNPLRVDPILVPAGDLLWLDD